MTVLSSVSLLALAATAVSAASLPGFYGYLNANSTSDVQYFYWGFDPASGNPVTTETPLVFWLTGGPGCSSILALFFENGPYTISADGSTMLPNPYGWNQDNVLVYVDQPAGTGFSKGEYSGYVVDEAEVAADFAVFLDNFYVKYPHLATNPLYIVGESFGGHYVPAIGSHLVDVNKVTPNTYNLQAIGVGNGYVDPYFQDDSWGTYTYAVGVIDESQFQSVQTMATECQQLIAAGQLYAADGTCFGTLQAALGYCSSNRGSQCNVYNYKAPCDGQLCYDFDNIATFLNNATNQQILGVNMPWQACNSQVETVLTNDMQRSYRHDIPNILAAKVDVTLYNGDLDIICNYFGTANYSASMKWPGQKKFVSATNTTFESANGTVYGNYRTHGGLTFVVVNEAGHMVPHDQPEAALALITNILAKSW